MGDTRTIRTMTAALAAAALSVPVTAAAAWADPAPPSGCRVEALPLPPRTVRGPVTAVDPTGRFSVGVSYRIGGGTVGLLWDGASLTAFDDPAVVDISEVVAANDDGVAVGNGRDAQDRRRTPWVYQDATIRRLALPEPLDAERVTVAAANDEGDIIGDAERPDGSRYLLTWHADTPDQVRATAPPAPLQSLVALTDEDTIVGTTYRGDGTDRTTGWLRRADGVDRVLTVPGADSVLVTAARDDYAAGTARIDGSWVPVRWSLPDGTAQLLDPALGEPVGVNNHGVVVGRTMVQRDAGATALPEVENRLAATGIGDNGVVVGYRLSGSSTRRPLRWVGCV